MDYTQQATLCKTVAYMKPRVRITLFVAMLAGFGLRVYHLAQQPLSWDEGWSIAMRSLPVSEVNRITALDVHPPFFYYVLKVLPTLGIHELSLRFVSVAAGVALIALAYAVGRAWCDETTGVLSSCLVAFSPFLVYYSQVVRMFALCATLTLLACHTLLKATATGRARWYLAFVLCATAALHTFYYTAFALAAVLLYSLLQHPRLWRRMIGAGLGLVLTYVPWLMYAVPSMAVRVGSRTGFSMSLVDVPGLLKDGLFGLVFAYGAGWSTVYVVVVVMALGLAAALLGGGARWHPIMLPLLAITLTLLAVSVGSQAHMFAARYVIAASPFLSLALAWSLAALWRRRWWLGGLGLVALAISAAPTLTGYVYTKSYEVSADFDPQAGYRFLQDKTRVDDVVFFNILSLAGHYERFHREGDPAWSYVQRWDPVIEDLEAAIDQRVVPAMRAHRRLWFVLYKGTVGANWALKEWLDQNLYPAFGQWREDTLYELYLTPTASMVDAKPEVTFGGKIDLDQAAFTPEARADDRMLVALKWVALEPVAQSFKVFVHLYDSAGRLVAQHDAVPANEQRPTSSWKPGEVVRDHHGLWVPVGTSGVLRLVVGLYDPATGQRLQLSDGQDSTTVGTVEVVP
jgi:mannosyltransferase